MRIRDYHAPTATGAGSDGDQSQGERAPDDFGEDTVHPDTGAIGEWGERYALRCLAEHYRRKYPDGDFAITDENFSIHLDGQRRVLGRWLNAGNNQQAGYDLSVEDGSDVLFIEVKATTTEARAVIDISGNQWRLAKRAGESFLIYRIYNAGKATAWATAIPDPARRWRDGAIVVSGLRLSV